MESDSLLTRLVLESASLGGKNSSLPQSWFTIKTSRSEYFFDPQPIEGDLSCVYFGYENNSEKTEVVLKLTRNVGDNDLMQNEIKVLKHLQGREAPQQKHLPVLLDQFVTDQNLVGLIFARFDGYTLSTIRENPRYKSGIPTEHMVWIFCRLLSAIGYANKEGVIHGNIEPSNILIQPRDHNLCLLDWTAALINPGKSGDGFKLYNPNYSAPEVKERRAPTPAADLYSAAKCMIYLLGGDAQTNKLPESVDSRIALFLGYFLLPSPLQRAQDAWQLYAQLQNLRTEIWGEEKFVKFDW